MLNLSTSDEGWFGKGIYLTQAPKYGQYYVNHCQQKEGNFSLLLCWTLLGKPFPVVDAQVKRGKNCEPGFTSHYTVVNENFVPFSGKEKIHGDELVIFESDYILPRFIVKYSLSKK